MLDWGLEFLIIRCKCGADISLAVFNQKELTCPHCGRIYSMDLNLLKDKD